MSVLESVPAEGTVLGRSLETCVDSKLAAQYLASFDEALTAPNRRPESLSSLPACSSQRLAPEALKQLAGRYSVDVAALYAAACLIRGNRTLSEDFEAHVAALREASARVRDDAALELGGFTVLMVPGWDYAESGKETGADFERQRALLTRLGVDNTLVPIDPVGSVEENAAVIRRELMRLDAEQANAVIISASSGGPAVALALDTSNTTHDFAAVRGWLNIGGILGGMPLIDEYSQGVRGLALRTFVRLKGWRMPSIESMSAKRSRERMRDLRLPGHLVVLNYVGIPLTGDVDRRIAFFYRGLRELGPNDGLTLITEPILPGTRTIVAVGKDHMFAADPEMDVRSIALASTLARAVSASQLASR